MLNDKMLDMKKLMVLACLLTFGLTQAQVEPTYEKAGDLVKATYFYTNGKIKQQGFFKNKKLEGTWKSFDSKGNKTAIAKYKNGKKVGKWFIWSKDGLKEINYENSIIASVQNWKQDNKVAVK